MTDVVEWFKDKFISKHEKNRQERVDRIAEAKKMAETGRYTAEKLNHVVEDITDRIKKNASNQ